MNTRAALAAEALAWLATRPPPPAVLAERVREAVKLVAESGAARFRGREGGDADAVAGSRSVRGDPPEPAAGLPGLLAEAGLDRLRCALALARAARRPPQSGAAADHHGDDRPLPRAAALDLLAADALLTYAFEAAAEVGAEAVESLAAEYGATRFVRLLDADDAGYAEQPDDEK